jgi:hypothetical protein
MEPCGRLRIGHLECRAILRPRLAPIIEPRSCDVCVTKPFLNFRDAGLIVERIRRRCGAQRVSPNAESERRGVVPSDL